jgi:hypothetical protein
MCVCQGHSSGLGKAVANDAVIEDLADYSWDFRIRMFRSFVTHT